MQRFLTYVVLTVLIAIAGVAYWYSHRSLVVERATIGTAPVQIPPAKDFVGQMAPRFDAVDRGGRPAGSASFQGRVAVINIWASWCGPCTEELPEVERALWQRFKPNVAVIAVAAGDTDKDVDTYNKDARLTFSLVADPDGDIADRFGGAGAIPRTYIIDKSGRIVYQAIGYSEEGLKETVAAVERAINAS